ASPVAVSEEKPQALTGGSSGVIPRRLNALASVWPCQSRPSPNITMAASPGAGSCMCLGERACHDSGVDAAADEALARLQRGHRHHGRAEQHAIDRIEIALNAGEDIGERLAVVLRLETRQVLGEGPCLLCACRDERC